MNYDPNAEIENDKIENEKEKERFDLFNSILNKQNLNTPT